MKRMRKLKRDDFRDRLASLYHQAHDYQWLADHLSDRIAQEIYNHPDYRKLTREDRGYLSGYRDSLQSRLWFEQVIWRLGPESGPLTADEQDRGWMTTSNPEGGKLSILCRQKGKLYGGHFWIGTEKPYTEYRVTNADYGTEVSE